MFLSYGLPERKFVPYWTALSSGRLRRARFRAVIDFSFRRALGATKYFLRLASRLAMRLSARKRRSAGSSSSGPSRTSLVPTWRCLSSKESHHGSAVVSRPLVSDLVTAR